MHRPLLLGLSLVSNRILGPTKINSEIAHWVWRACAGPAAWNLLLFQKLGLFSNITQHSSRKFWNIFIFQSFYDRSQSLIVVSAAARARPIFDSGRHGRSLAIDGRVEWLRDGMAVGRKGGTGGSGLLFPCKVRTVYQHQHRTNSNQGAYKFVKMKFPEFCRFSRPFE